MALPRAHELAARAKAAGLTIEQMIQRAGVLPAVWDGFRSLRSVTSDAVVRSLLRVVEEAEAQHAAGE